MEHMCNICNKNYSSYKSLWTHNKKYHNTEINTKSTLESTKNNINPENTNSCDNTMVKKLCKYCDKEFNTKQSKSRHEKNYCKKRKEENDKIKELEKKIDKLTEIICKQTPNKTINKGTIINNNIYNNIKIELGVEDMKLLSEDQKLKVLKSINYGELPIVTLVDELYKMEKNRNIKISNLQNNIALKYDGDIERFKATSKKQVINDIISVRKHDIKAFFEEFCDSNKINEKTKASIEKYLNKLNSSSEKNAELRKFMNEHKEQIIFIIYNITLLEEETNDNSFEL